ncbi:hypothetical protein HOLleu_37900 [Holothuria leucospilota]|uniref:Uncharacterized protein n=1 Tax=Holothuria leucospilota TaxID=206669 RepID=A0A9Q1BDP7_HOLLE|nr:hypothetical protein HOLleu_37900 [Holothuria leucospilota]
MAETLEKVRPQVDHLGRVNLNNNNAVLLGCQKEDISRFPAMKPSTDDVNNSVDATSKSVFGRQTQLNENERSVVNSCDSRKDGAVDFNFLYDTSPIPNIESNVLNVSMGYEDSFKNELRKAMVTVAKNRENNGLLKKLRYKFLSRKKDRRLKCTTIYCQCIDTVVTNSTQVQPNDVTRTNRYINSSVFRVLSRLVVDIFGCDLPDDT